MSSPSALDRLTGRLLLWLVSVGLTPSRWPGTACGTVIFEVARRRSRRLQSVLVTWVEHGGSRYLVTMPGETPQWVKNAKAAGNQAVLRHGRRRTPVRLEEVPSAQRAAILQVWYRTTSRSASPRRHFMLDRDAGIDDFERLAPAHPVYRIEAGTNEGPPGGSR